MASNAPRFQSKLIPGLVMWTNGAIVRVAVDENGVIKRTGATYRVEVLESLGRTSIDEDDLARAVFQTVEKYLVDRGAQ